MVAVLNVPALETTRTTEPGISQRPSLTLKSNRKTPGGATRSRADALSDLFPHR